MSVLGQQSSHKRKKVEFDLRFEKQSFKPEQNYPLIEDESLSSIVDHIDNDNHFKSSNSK